MAVMLWIYSKLLFVRPGRGVKYCEYHVCMSVCTHFSNFTKFLIHIDYGSVILWQQCNELCTSSFMDVIMGYIHITSYIDWPWNCTWNWSLLSLIALFLRYKYVAQTLLYASDLERVQIDRSVNEHATHAVSQQALIMLVLCVKLQTTSNWQRKTHDASLVY